MRYTAILFLVLLALLQVSLIPPIPLLNVRPHLILLFAIAWAMLQGLREGAIVAFAGGIALDMFSSLPLGSHALILLLTTLPIGLLGTPFYQGNLAFPIIGVFLAVFSYHVFLLALLQVLGETVLWGNTLVRLALPQSLVLAALMPLAYWTLSRLDRRKHRHMTIG